MPDPIEGFLEVDETTKKLLVFQICFYQQPLIEYLFSNTPVI